MLRLFRFGLILTALLICVSAEEDKNVGGDDVEENNVGGDAAAEEEENNAGGDAVAEEEQPDYEIPAPEDVFYYETFSSEIEESSWVISDHNEGEFRIGRGSQKTGIKSEQGLVLEEEAKHYRISTKFLDEFDPENQDLVIQYEVRFHKNHECGGAYLKVLKSDADFDTKKFNGDTDYSVMFGPDKCGSSDKVHFIFKHQHKKTLEWEEKHLKNPPTMKNDRYTHLYTLVIRTDNTYEMFIDQKSVASGKLLEDFEPSVNPPKEIDDPEDTKPDDWVDNAKINDPAASKPDDWDEDAPREILDPSPMPTGWEEDEELKIDDPTAEEPEDWDADDDGEWGAPLIDNPACSVGCGPWEPSMIPNPDYKGKWIHPKIDNPDYKGEWEAKQIPNPDYFEDLEPHQLHPMGGVGIEIWTMQNQIEFDNVFIDSSLEAAIEFGKATWAIKYEFEAAQDPNNSLDAGLFSAIGNAASSFMDYCSNNPVIGIVILMVILLVIAVIVWMFANMCCPDEFESNQGQYRREIKSRASNDDEDEDESGDEGEPAEGEENKKNVTQEEGVDKVKEKETLKQRKKVAGQKNKKEDQVKEQKKQPKEKKKLKKKKSRKTD